MTDNNELARKGLSSILDLSGGKPKQQEHPRGNPFGGGSHRPITTRPGTWSGTQRPQRPLDDFRSGGDLFNRFSDRNDDDLDIPGFLDRRTGATHARPLSDDLRHLSEDDGREDGERQEWEVGRLGARHFETSLPQCKARFNDDGTVRLVDHDELCALSDAAYVVLLDVLSAQGFRLTTEARTHAKVFMRDIYETVIDTADHHDSETGELMPVVMEEDNGE